MNSLNLLSARVIGRVPHSPQPTVKSARSRSIGEERSTSASHTPPPRRSASHREIAGSSLVLDEKDRSDNQHDDSMEEETKEGSLDEKTPLIIDKSTVQKPTVKPSRNTLLFVARRIAHALADSLRWVLSKLAAPGVYVIACFYDNDGHFSPLLPLRSRRRNPPGQGRPGSTAHAVGLSGSSDPNDRVAAPDYEKRTLRSSTPTASHRSRSIDTLSTSTSDSEGDRKGKGASGLRDKRQKGQSLSSAGDTVPARRSIRIKLNSEDSTRRRRAKKTPTEAITADDATVVTPDAITAANLKSPTSPASSLRLTKYPHAPAPPRPLIPRRQPSYTGPVSQRSSTTVGQKTLVIDLDETLIHSLAKGGRMSSGHMVEVKLSHPAAYNGLSLGSQHPILYYVHKRPHCDDFLRKVCKWYNLVVFTASVQEYADPVIDWLEQERQYFSARYYRQHCTFRNGAYIKDLSSVEPDLSRVVILDNSPLSYIFHEGTASKLHSISSEC